MKRYNLTTLFALFVHYGNAYIYHNHISLKMPYNLHYTSTISNDVKIIDMDDAYKLSSFWYEELKYQQKYEEQEQTDTFNRRNIKYLYSNNNDDYLNMNNMMNFKYNVETNNLNTNEYIIWKPKIKPQFMNEKKTNSLFYPCFRQCMCLIGFQRSFNDIYIENMIYSPFWKGDVRYIQKKTKTTLIDYFLSELKYREIHFCDA